MYYTFHFSRFIRTIAWTMFPTVPSPSLLPVPRVAFMWAAQICGLLINPDGCRIWPPDSVCRASEAIAGCSVKAILRIECAIPKPHAIKRQFQLYGTVATSTQFTIKYCLFRTSWKIRPDRIGFIEMVRVFKTSL